MAMLAVLKAGDTFVPVVPGVSDARLSDINQELKAT